MFIRNNRPRIHAIGVSYVDKETNTARTETLSLKPGINEIDDDAWPVAMENKITAWHVEQGDLEVVKGKSGGPASKESALTGATSGDGASPNVPRSLSDLTVPDAKELIEETYDQALLKRWKSQDDRVGVAHAIEAQLEKMKLQKKEQDEAEAEAEDEDQA